MLFIAFKGDCTLWTNPLLIQILAPCLAAPTMQKKCMGLPLADMHGIIWKHVFLLASNYNIFFLFHKYYQSLLS